MAGEDEILGARRRGKGTHIALSITQQPEATRGVQASLKSPVLSLWLAAWGWGISRRKQIPNAIKKGHFLQRQLAWRGERVLCCNRGEGRALTQPRTAGEAARPRLPSPGTHGRQGGRAGQRLGKGEGWR